MNGDTTTNKMIFQPQPKEKLIFDLVSEAAKSIGVDAYVVGGYVRDRLLGRPSKDMDIVCIGSGIALAQAVAARLSPQPKVVTYERFGTAMLRHRDIEIEFVGARRESYRSDSRKPTVENGSLEDDQRRRDFTINALAFSLNEANFGEIIDPFDGIRHLEQKIIQTPLEPQATFSDDPLRMMRAVRFATQLGFQIEQKTFDGIVLAASRLKIISKERIIGELEKMMNVPTPSVGWKLLLESNLLAQFFPEMVALRGVEAIDGHFHKDNFFHTLQVLDNVAAHSDQLWLRWAAIFHDIGKPATKRLEPPRGWTFHGHQEVGANMLPRLFRQLGLPLDERLKYVQKMVRMHHRPVVITKEEVTSSAIRRLLFDVGEDYDDLMLLVEADITSKNPVRVQKYLEGYQYVRQRCVELEESDKIRNWQPPIDGELIMKTFNIPPSQPVGIIKTAIREAILDGIITNDFDAAHALMLEEGQKMGLTAIL